MSAVIVVIPAYEPDRRLVELVAGLRHGDPTLGVLVVDDGSGPAYREVFAAAREAGAEVLSHLPNRGKGFALKEAFRHVAEHHTGHAVVCADADGQHSVVDVLRVAARVRETDAMVLGGRRFTGPVPWRSRAGNATTRVLVRLVTGLDVHDTQTGLRGYPATMLDWLCGVRGDRFEYELRLLLEAGPAGHRVEEVGIATIYLEENASSHFRPVADSVRVLAPLLWFAASSLAAFAIDTAALLVLAVATGSLLAAVVGARVISASANLAINRHVTFRPGRGAPLPGVVVRYAALAVTLLGASYAALSLLSWVGAPLLAAKVLSDAGLFLVSYRVQRSVVFRDYRAEPGTGQASPVESRRTSAQDSSPTAPTASQGCTGANHWIAPV